MGPGLASGKGVTSLTAIRPLVQKTGEQASLTAEILKLINTIDLVELYTFMLSDGAV